MLVTEFKVLNRLQLEEFGLKCFTIFCNFCDYYFLSEALENIIPNGELDISQSYYNSNRILQIKLNKYQGLSQHKIPIRAAWLYILSNCTSFPCCFKCPKYDNKADKALAKYQSFIKSTKDPILRERCPKINLMRKISPQLLFSGIALIVAMILKFLSSF